MNMSAESWQRAEIPGPKKALVFAKPQVVATKVKIAKRPILVVGHEAFNTSLNEEKVIDYIINIAKAAEIPVVATAHIFGEFVKRGFQPATWMSVMDITNRLQDPDWKGLDGMGQYDLALFVGIPYYMEWTILSSLKHFSSDLTTISLGRFYQPHATCSFSNLSLKYWIECLKVIISELGEK
jgi:acetyl-CoA decarbonylase/synthase complex subunit epsilon